MSITLYDAVAALGITEEWLEEAGGELTPEIEALLNDAEMAFAEKVERVALKAKALDAESEMIATEGQRVMARAKVRANAAKSLKTYLERCLVAAGETKVTGLLATVALQQNPPKLNVPDNADLAELYGAGCPGVVLVPERYEVNKAELLSAVKTRGEDVLPTGFTITRGTSLRIR